MKSGYSVAVTSTASEVVPNQGVIGTTAWATGAIAAKSYRLGSNGITYWTPNGGTATSGQEPTHSSGVDVGTDSIEWVALNKHRKLRISADRDNACSLSLGATPVDGEDTVLDSAAPVWDLGNHSGAVYAITATTATLAVSLF